MDRVDILYEKDSAMMHEFSRLSLNRIDGPLVSMAFSLFSSYMEANVRKEVEKDRLIIGEAAAAHAAGHPACDMDLEDIFEKTKETDKAFLQGLMIPSFALTVRYSDFADIRIRRIWRIAKTVYALLDAWTEGASFSDAARKSYAAGEFRETVAEILHLYSLETRMLGDAIRSPFRTTMRDFAESLFHAMEQAKEELSNDYMRKIYDGAAVGTRS